MAAGYDVYVSYNARDTEAVYKLVDRLQGEGLNVFIDRDLSAGTEWPAALRAAMARSRTVAVFFGPEGLGRWQSEEVGALTAQPTSSRVIPVLLPGAEEAKLPRSLGGRKWVDFRGGLNDEKAFRDLLRGIQESAPSPSPSPPMEEPERPLFDRLSPRAKNAILRADRFRSVRRAGRIHMEHLLVGLFDEGDEPVRQAFERAEIDRRRLVQILRRVKLNLPSPDRGFEPSDADSLPPLSGHSEQALNAAKGLADAEGATVIDTAHLLRGFLSITECEVVDVFTKAGLHLEVGPRLPEFSIRPASAGDQPVDQDNLGFAPYIEAIAEFLVNEDTRPPLTLSIEGEWGSGKSSFMLQLEKALQRRCQSFGPWLRSRPEWLAKAWKGSWKGRWMRLRRELQAPCCLTVRFNAWRHDKEDALWAAFASEFLRRIAGQRFFLQRWLGHLRLFIFRFRWRNGWLEMLRAAAVWSLLLAFGIALPVLAYSAGWTFNVTSWFETLGKAEDLLKGMAVFGGAGAYLAGLISLYLKAKDVVGNPLEINLRKYLQSPDYDGHVTFIESFHEDFRRIVDAYAGKRKVYVFIDDLDRCEVPKAADLMQGLNLLIADDPRLIFIMGMDREKVAAGLAVKYEKLLPYLMPDGRDEKGNVDPRLALDYGFTFIEKFVQLPFRVPSPQPVNLRWFLATLSGRTPGAARPVAESAGQANGAPAPESASPGEVQGPAAKPSAAGPMTAPQDGNGDRVAVEQQTARRERLKLVLKTDSEAFEEAALMVAPTLDDNPRRLKQFVNLFRLRAFIAGEIGAFDEVGGRTLTLPQLGKFVAISLAWPGLLTDLAEKPDLLTDLQKTALGDESRAEIWAKQPEGRWFRLSALKSLLRYGCVENSGFSGPPDPKTYSLADADLDRLLRVSPKVVRAPSPSQRALAAEARQSEFPEPESSRPLSKSPAISSDLYRRFLRRSPPPA